jgi:hypothetical protein
MEWNNGFCDPVFVETDQVSPIQKSTSLELGIIETASFKD